MSSQLASFFSLASASRKLINIRDGYHRRGGTIYSFVFFVVVVVVVVSFFLYVALKRELPLILTL